MHVHSLEELVIKHVEMGSLYNDTLFFSIYEYQMGACMSPAMTYPTLGDIPKDHFQAWDNPLLSLDQI